MSHDNLILCYKVFETEEEKNFVKVKVTEHEAQINSKNTKEVFNVAQCHFPGSTGEIALDNVFLQGDHLIGENILLMEIQPVPGKPYYR